MKKKNTNTFTYGWVLFFTILFFLSSIPLNLDDVHSLTHFILEHKTPVVCL